HLADRVPRHLQVTCDLLDRLALDEVLASYPRNRRHDKHPQPPASFESRQPNRPTYRGSILDADPLAQGVNIAGRMTRKSRGNCAAPGRFVPETSHPSTSILVGIGGGIERARGSDRCSVGGEVVEVGHRGAL